MNATLNGSSPDGPHLKAADGAVLILKPGETLLGREPGCDIQLPDPSVSKKHCAVGWSEGGFSVTDLGSTNHTFVNQICLQQGQSARLVHGDRLVLGRSTLTFFEPERESGDAGGRGVAGRRDADKEPSESTMVSFAIGMPPYVGGKQPLSEAAVRELKKANEPPVHLLRLWEGTSGISSTLTGF